MDLNSDTVQMREEMLHDINGCDITVSQQLLYKLTLKILCRAAFTSCTQEKLFGSVTMSLQRKIIYYTTDS